MARPKDQRPTPAELEVLKILWQCGPSTVRGVMDRIDRRPRPAYTSVMSLLGVMADKKLVDRRTVGRAFQYSAAVERESTLADMVSDLLGRAFEGSASALVARLLDASSPNEAELNLIHRTIEDYRARDEEA